MSCSRSLVVCGDKGACSLFGRIGGRGFACLFCLGVWCLFIFCSELVCLFGVFVYCVLSLSVCSVFGFLWFSFGCLSGCRVGLGWVLFREWIYLLLVHSLHFVCRVDFFMALRLLCSVHVICVFLLHRSRPHRVMGVHRCPACHIIAPLNESASPFIAYYANNVMRKTCIPSPTSPRVLGCCRQAFECL